MEQAINCPKENCNGILEEGIRGFYKCTVCGAKVKKSLVQKSAVPTVSTPVNAQPVPPVLPQFEQTPTAPPMVVTSVFPLATQQVVEQAVNLVAQTSKEVSDVAKKKSESAPKVAKTVTQKVVTNDGIQLVGKTLAIKCIDCGGERIIKVQDAFQVKRCVNCQKTYSKARRAEKAKAKRSATTTTPTA